MAFWWRRLPTWVSQRWPPGGVLLADGGYLARWRPAGSLGPPAAILAGALLGGYLRLAAGSGYPLPFTASLPLMGAMLTVGVLSGALGSWLVLGYSVGQFLVLDSAQWEHSGDNPIAVFLRVRGSVLIADLLLFALVGFAPMIARRLRAGLVARMRQHVFATPAMIQTSLQAALMAGLTAVWVLAAQVIIRPWFLWHGLWGAEAAYAPLQLHGVVLVLVGVAAVILRTVLERLASTRPAPPELTAGGPPLPLAAAKLRRHLPVPYNLLVRATVTTCLLAGLASDWAEAGVLWSVLVLAEVARAFATASTRWREAVTRVPIALRFLAIVGASLLAGWLTITPAWQRGTTLAPLIYALGPSLCLAGALLPRRLASSVPPPRAS